MKKLCLAAILTLIIFTLKLWIVVRSLSILLIWWLKMGRNTVLEVKPHWIIVCSESLNIISLKFYLRHVPGREELHIAVVVGGRCFFFCFYKCAPVGWTASRPHPHWSLDSSFHGTQIKWCGCHLGFLMGRTNLACRPLQIIHCPGLLHHISFDFVWIECWSRWRTPKIDSHVEYILW